MSAASAPAVTPKIAPAEAMGTLSPVCSSHSASVRPTMTFTSTSSTCPTVVGRMSAWPWM